MPAQKKALSLMKNATWELSLRYLDSDHVPVDLTGYVASIQLHHPATGTTYGSFNAATLGSDGWINFKLTTQQTADLPSKHYAYQILLFEPDSDTKVLLYGPLTIKTVTD